MTFVRRLINRLRGSQRVSKPFVCTAWDSPPPTPAPPTSIARAKRGRIKRDV